ncbi:MAG: sugar transferase [Clostridia bacterium]|nr:sugar transferase [Clostridia bacterium]
MYQRYTKRILDFFAALIAICILSPFLILFTIIGAFAMRGNPFFRQPRPGKDGKIFFLLKFRSMNNRRDKSGNLLPDEKRLTAYGRLIRALSIDELPSLFNILRGDLSLVGPRPQLVLDMVFMNERERQRHSVRQGLTGLAQVNGRNAISWDEKFAYDLQYIEKITFWGDLKILLRTVGCVLDRRDVSQEGMATAEDFCDYLLKNGRIDQATYDAGKKEAARLIAEAIGK